MQTADDLSEAPAVSPKLKKKAKRRLEDLASAIESEKAAKPDLATAAEPTPAAAEPLVSRTGKKSKRKLEAESTADTDLVVATEADAIKKKKSKLAKKEASDIEEINS